MKGSHCGHLDILDQDGAECTKRQEGDVTMSIYIDGCQQVSCMDAEQNLSKLIYLKSGDSNKPSITDEVTN